MARIYDLQHTPELKDTMTFTSETTGNRVSYSYLLPKSAEDLKKKWDNTTVWMKETWGQLPRLPDFMSNIVVGLYDVRKQLGTMRPEFEQNAVRYHQYCQEHDLCLTYAIGDPQVDRSKGYDAPSEFALKIVEEREDGIVISGARTLSTFAPVAHEALIWIAPKYIKEVKEHNFWCAVPMNAPGLKTVCRESYAANEKTDGHWFTARYDEQDPYLIFDNVFVPWNRVFLLHDKQMAFKLFRPLIRWGYYSGLIRFHERFLVMLGIAELMSSSIGTNKFPNVQEKMGELAMTVELIRATLVSSQLECYETEGGLYSPGEYDAASTYCMQFTERATPIIKDLGASGVITQPSEKDLANSELRPYLDKYMGSYTMDTAHKARVFRLAWDLAGSACGIRQTMYDVWHRAGTPNNYRIMYNLYNKTDIVERLKWLLEHYND